MYSNLILKNVLDEIDDSNFHVCGNTWGHLNELVDCPGQCVGTIAAWIVVVGAEWLSLPIDDSRESLEEYGLDRIASEWVGFDVDELEGLPIGIVRQRIESILNERKVLNAGLNSRRQGQDQAHKIGETKAG